MIKKFIEKYSKIIKYVLFSGITAMIEAIIGLICINLFGLSEVISNTLGIIVGSSVHYLCITKNVFGKSTNIKSVIIYISTFILGMLIQNSVLWAVCRLLNDSFEQNAVYLIAKFCSLAVSFVLMYGIRKFLYSKI